MFKTTVVRASKSLELNLPEVSFLRLCAIHLHPGGKFSSELRVTETSPCMYRLL